MRKNEEKVLKAIATLGGEASSFQIHRELAGENKWWSWLFGMSYGRMHEALSRLELRDVIRSRWGEPVVDKGYLQPRIYTIVSTSRTESSP